MSMAAKRLLLLGLVILTVISWRAATVATTAGPQFTADGKLMFPDGYRQWTYLTTGFDMSYSPNAQPGSHRFDNVFVNPDAFAEFQRTGTWPDGTMLVLEVRTAQGKGSINQSGDFQTSFLGAEVHVRDSKRFAGNWGFFGFGDGDKTSTQIPTTASCYACHSKNAAVDTTFVQFYPTLLPIATEKKTLSSGYEHAAAAAAASPTASP
jgi:hypothetical protein